MTSAISASADFEGVRREERASEEVELRVIGHMSNSVAIYVGESLTEITPRTGAASAACRVTVATLNKPSNILSRLKFPDN